MPHFGMLRPSIWAMQTDRMGSGTCSTANTLRAAPPKETAPLKLYPRTKEIYVITVLTQDREAINKKRNTVVIKILPAVEREDVVESKVVYYDYDLRIRAFKKLYEQVMDASCLPCED